MAGVRLFTSPDPAKNATVTKTEGKTASAAVKKTFCPRTLMGCAMSSAR